MTTQNSDAKLCSGLLDNPLKGKAQEWYAAAFKRWWDADYSLSGLKNKAVRSNGNLGNLQAVWLKLLDDPIAFGGRLWSAAHVPPHDLDGNPLPQGMVSEERQNAINRALVEFYKHEMGKGPFAGVGRGPIAIPLMGAVIREIPAEIWLLLDKMPPNFSDAIFDCKVHVTKSMHESAWFERTVFLKNVNFSHELEEAVFSNCLFVSDVVFGISSVRAAKFAGTRYCKLADFKGSQFRDVNFSKSEFAGLADFHDVGFLGDFTDFRDCVFSDDAVFSSKRIAGGNALGFEGLIYFDRCRFEHEARFNNRTFQDRTSFNGAHFADLPLFYNATLNRNTHFDRVTFAQIEKETVERPSAFNDKGERIHRDASAADYQNAYRVLRGLSSDNENHEHEQLFYEREIEARIKRKIVPTSEKAAAFIFKHVSEYGSNLWLPWAWWVIGVHLTYIALLLYVNAFVETYHQPSAGQQYALVVGRFAPIPGTALPIGINYFLEHHALIVGAIGFLAPLYSAVLLGAFLITIRRRFALK